MTREKVTGPCRPTVIICLPTSISSLFQIVK